MGNRVTVAGRYQVIVSNIGVMEFATKKQARECYRDYVKQSKGKPCRAHTEDVTLTEDGEPVDEFIYDQYKLKRLRTNVDIRKQELRLAKDILAEYKLEKGLI